MPSRRHFLALSGAALGVLLFLSPRLGSAQEPELGDYDPQFLTDEERETFSRRRQNATSEEEIGRIRMEEHSRAQERAEKTLLSEEERTLFQERMKNAETREERQRISEEHHAVISDRAKERGLKWPDDHPKNQRTKKHSGSKKQGQDDKNGGKGGGKGKEKTSDNLTKGKDGKDEISEPLKKRKGGGKEGKAKP